jgi:hypothetical protein
MSHHSIIATIHPIDDAGALADQVLALTVGPLGIFLFRRRDLCHAAMARLAAQPAEKGTLQQLGIEPIRLRPAMLARHGNTCRVDHISLDATSSQPPCQPEAVPAGFVGHRDPINRAAWLGRFVPPAIQQLEQRRLIGRKFLQRLSVDPRNYAAATSQVDRLISMTAIVFYPDPERRAICSGHSAAAWGTPSVVSSDDDALSSPLAP